MIKKMHTEPLHTSDEELAQQVQTGHRTALAQLVDRHAKRFFRIAYRILKNRDDAEDMVQTAFLKFWRKPFAWDPQRQSKFSTWFYRVVTNLCLDQIKRKKPKDIPVEVLNDESHENPEGNLEKIQQQKVLELFISHLPERQRTALNLCFYEGLSNQEAAEVMGLKVKALQSLIMRAKGSLREKIKEMEKGDLR